jgi:type IV pilus modification protein PilV
MRALDKQGGVATLEVLITMVVMAFGLMSLLALQYNSLSYVRGANQNYLAASLAQSIGESMRANAESSGNYSSGTDDDDTVVWDSISSDCVGVCASDMQAWLDLIDASFPNEGGGLITFNTNLANISIRWLDKDSESVLDFNEFTLQVPINTDIRPGAANGNYN